MPEEKSHRGDLLIFTGVLIFGAYGLFLRFFPEISALAFLFFLQVVGAAGFFFISIKRRVFGVPSVRMFYLFVGLAAVAVLNDLFYYISFRTTTIANATLTHQMASFFLLFFAPRVLGEKTTSREWGSLMLAFAGIAIIYGGALSVSAGEGIGIILGLASALFYALLIIIYRLLHRGGISINLANFWRHAVSILILLPFFLVDGGGIDTGDVVPLATFGLIFAVIGSGIHTYGISLSRALHSAIIGKSGPVIAAAYALLLLGEIPATTTIVGGALIIGAGAWLALYKHPHSSA